MKKTLADLELFRAGDQTMLREILHPKNDQLDLGFSLAHAYLEPGQCSLPHRLLGRSETYHFLSGVGSIHIDGEKSSATVGDTVFVREGASQYVVNEGDSPLCFLCIVSPPWSPASDVLGD